MAREIRVELQILRDMKITMKRFLIILPLLQQEEVDLDIDKLFKEAKWKEITEIPEKEIYELDNITATAGVRGNEAEHQILNYLYYVIDTKTGKNSLKINKP